MDSTASTLENLRFRILVCLCRELYWLVFIGELELLEPDFGMLFAENQCHVTVGGSNLLLCLPINF